MLQRQLFIPSQAAESAVPWQPHYDILWIGQEIICRDIFLYGIIMCRLYNYREDNRNVSIYR